MDARATHAGLSLRTKLWQNLFLASLSRLLRVETSPFCCWLRTYKAAWYSLTSDLHSVSAASSSRNLLVLPGTATFTVQAPIPFWKLTNSAEEDFALAMTSANGSALTSAWSFHSCQSSARSSTLEVLPSALSLKKVSKPSAHAERKLSFTEKSTIGLATEMGKESKQTTSAFGGAPPFFSAAPGETAPALPLPSGVRPQ